MHRFRFPKNHLLKRKWLKAIGRTCWKPPRNACVCSKHFSPKQVAYAKSNFKKLKTNAIPDTDVPNPVDGVGLEDNIDNPSSLNDGSPGVVTSPICKICMAINVKMHNLQKGILYTSLLAIPALYENYFFKELPQYVCYICAILLVKTYKLIEERMAAHKTLTETYSINSKIPKKIVKDENRKKLKHNRSLQSHKSTPTTVFEYVYSEIDKISVLTNSNSYSNVVHSICVGNDKINSSTETEESAMCDGENVGETVVNENLNGFSILQLTTDKNAKVKEIGSVHTQKKVGNESTKIVLENNNYIKLKQLDSDITYNPVDTKDGSTSKQSAMTNIETNVKCDSVIKKSDSTNSKIIIKSNDLIKAATEPQAKAIETSSDQQIKKNVDYNVDNCLRIVTKNKQSLLLFDNKPIKSIKSTIGNKKKIIIKAVKVSKRNNKTTPPENQAIDSENKVIEVNINTETSDNKPEQLQIIEQRNVSENDAPVESSNDPSDKIVVVKEAPALRGHFDVVELTPEQQVEDWAQGTRMPAWDYLKTYKCEQCSKRFLRGPAFYNHMVTHDPKSGKFMCSVCKARFPTDKCLQMHRRLTHRRKFYCKQCPVVLRNESSARKHLGAHAQPRDPRVQLAAHAAHAAHTCAHCARSFRGPRGFLLHLRYAHPREFIAQDPLVNEYRCVACDINFFTKDEKREHVRTSCPHKQTDNPNESDDSEMQHKCSTCDEVFPTRRVLQAHVRDEHAPVDPPLPDTGTTPPPPIPSVTLQSGEPNSYPLQCEHCSEMIKTRLQHWLHTRKEHPDKVSSYKSIIKVTCSHCGKGYQNATQLRRHERLHARAALRCAACPRRFRDARALRQHAGLHAARAPWRCPCGAAFRSRPNLARHKKVHSNETPYNCPMCEKKFKYSSSVGLHVRSVHYKTPYKKKSQPRIPKAKTLNAINDHDYYAATTVAVSEEFIEVQDSSTSNVDVIEDLSIEDQNNEGNSSNQVAGVSADNNESLDIDVSDVSFEIMEVEQE